MRKYFRQAISFFRRSDDELTLTQRTVQNISIGGGATVVSRALRTVSAVVLARMLTPEDYSIVGVSLILLGFLSQFSDMGFYAAVVQRKDKVEEAQYTGFYLRLALSILVAVLLFALAPLWASFYKTPAITNVIRISLLSVIIAPIGFIPATYFLRKLQFKKAAISGIANNFAYVIVAVILALLGFRYWSIVWGTVVGSIVGIVVSCYLHPWKLKFKFNKVVAKDLFSFGKFILVCGLLGFAISNVDNMLIGKIAGMTLLGYYVMAYKWGFWINDNLVQIIGGVLFPTFSKINDDVNRMKNGYMKTMKYLSLVVFPATVGFIMVAPQFIEVILGSKWLPATHALQILCICGLLKAIGMVESNIFIAIGKPKINMICDTLFLSILLILIVPLTVKFGIIGASFAVLVASILGKIYQYIQIQKLLSIQTSDFIKSVNYPLIGTAVMFFGIIAMIKIMNIFNINLFINLIICISVGSLIYGLTLYYLDKKDLTDFIHVLKYKQN